jgi:hypothetical protein
VTRSRLTASGGLVDRVASTRVCSVVNVSDIGKRLLLGRKLRSTQLGETLLPKRIALRSSHQMPCPRCVRAG